MAKKNTNLNKDRDLPKVASILDAAIEVLGTERYGNSTISDRCGAAKVSDVALYTCFQSKKNVLFTIPERDNKNGHDRITKILPNIENYKEIISKFDLVRTPVILPVKSLKEMRLNIDLGSIPLETEKVEGGKWHRLYGGNLSKRRESAGLL